MNTTTQTAPTNTPEVVTTAPEFGAGRYSPLMEECYADAQVVFSLPSNKAEKLARQIGSEVGALMRNTPVTVKTGKVSEDGKLTLSEAAKLKGVQVTNAIMALRAMHWANDAVKNGFSRKSTKWTVIPQLANYFEGL